MLQLIAIQAAPHPLLYLKRYDHCHVSLYPSYFVSRSKNNTTKYDSKIVDRMISFRVVCIHSV